MLHAACVYFPTFDSPAVSVRVRDINDAFTELGRMVALHMALDRPLTKLAILQHAVTLITELERKVQGRSSTQLVNWLGGGFCGTSGRFRHSSVSVPLLTVYLLNDLLCVEWDVKLYSLTHSHFGAYMIYTMMTTTSYL